MSTQPLETLSEMPYEAEVLADQLTDGKPELGWRGDPRLSLVVGVISAGKTGYSSRVGRYVTVGQAIGYRYEVWRHCEDGEDRRILSKPMDKLHEVLPELCKMDPRSPGFVDSFVQAEKDSDKAHAEAGYRIREAQGEMAEHLFALWHDRNNPQHTFRQVGGSDERPDRNLASDA